MTDETTDVVNGLLAEGKRFYAQNETVKARGCLEEAFRLAPANTEVAVFLAHLYLESKDSARAERLLTEMIAQGVSHPVARLTLSQVYLELGRFDEAMRQLDSVWLDISQKPALEKQFGQVVTKLAYKGLDLWEQGHSEGRTALEGAMRLRPNLRWASFAHKWLRSREALADIGQLVLDGQINDALAKLQSEEIGEQLNRLLGVMIDTQQARLNADARVVALESDLSSLRLNMREQAKENDVLQTRSARLDDAEQSLMEAQRQVDVYSSQLEESQARNRELVLELETTRTQAFQLLREAFAGLRQEVGDVFGRIQDLMEQSFDRTQGLMETAFSRSQLVMEEAFSPPVPTLLPETTSEPVWEPPVPVEPEPAVETDSMDTTGWELPQAEQDDLTLLEPSLAEAPLEWSAFQIAETAAQTLETDVLDMHDLQFEAGEAEPVEDLAINLQPDEDDTLLPLEEITLEAWKED